MTKHLDKILNLSQTDFTEIYSYLNKIKDDPKNNCFSKQEDKFLLDNYYNLGVHKCAKILNRPIGSITTRAKYLGVKSKVNYTQEEKDFIIKYYPIYGSKYCAAKLNRSFTAIQKYAEATLQIKGKTKNKSIYCVELDKVYNSAAEAAAELGILRTSIANCLSGISNTAGGYH